MNEWVTVAVLGRPRGNRGELTAVSLSDHPERFERLTKVSLFGGSGRSGADPWSAQIEEAWFHQGTLIFKFSGIDSISEAELLTGAEVRIPYAKRLPLEPGEFYHSDLIGCDVRDRHSNCLIGTVTGFEDGGSSGLLQIGPSVLIPFSRDICVSIAPERREILVDLPEGLLEINQ